MYRKCYITPTWKMIWLCVFFLETFSSDFASHILTWRTTEKSLLPSSMNRYYAFFQNLTIWSILQRDSSSHIMNCIEMLRSWSTWNCIGHVPAFHEANDNDNNSILTTTFAMTIPRLRRLYNKLIISMNEWLIISAFKKRHSISCIYAKS